MCLAYQENGNSQRTTRKRISEREMDNSKELYETLYNRSGRHRKVPRRSATVAANKLRLMSDVEEELSSSESVGIGSKNRKLPHRNASAAARKVLLNDSEESSIQSESDKEEEESNRRKTFKAGSGAVAVRKKHASESDSGSSDSENSVQKTLKGCHVNGQKQSQRATHCASPKIKSPVEFSEDDSKSLVSEDGSIQKAAYQLPSASRSNNRNISEADSEPEKCNGLEKQTCKRVSTHFRKAKVLSDSDEGLDSGKEDERVTFSESRGSSKMSRLPKDSSKCSSDLESGTDSSNSTKRRKNRKGDVF